MPVMFQFIEVATGETVPLTRIDEIVCDFCGEKPHEEDFSLNYNLLLEVAIAGKMRDDRTGIDELLKELEVKEPEYVETFRFYRRMLLDEYRFVAWRGQR
jgi:hypothetical protein